MFKYITIQKFAHDVGIDESYVRTMIKKELLTAYKIDGYKRIYINIEEFNSTVKPITNKDKAIDLSNYLV